MKNQNLQDYVEQCQVVAAYLKRNYSHLTIQLSGDGITTEILVSSATTSGRIGLGEKKGSDGWAVVGFVGTAQPLVGSVTDVRRGTEHALMMCVAMTEALAMLEPFSIPCKSCQAPVPWV